MRSAPTNYDIPMLQIIIKKIHLVLLRDQLGHTSVEVTSIYTNINNEKKREAIDRLEKDNLNKTGYFLKEVSCFIVSTAPCPSS